MRRIRFSNDASKDHFYICLGHLTDRGFATPVVDEADVASKKKQEELDREIELVKKEYGEKLSRKKKTKDEKKQGAAKKDDKSEEKEGQDKDDDAKAEKGKDEKVASPSCERQQRLLIREYVDQSPHKQAVYLVGR